MFCTNCGSKIEEGAFFCGNCGCRIAGPAANTGHEPSPAQPQNAAYAQQSVQYPLEAPVAPQRSSFASFLTERRQIGRAMVPTFAIILAAMIAAAGTAYALCKAYQVFVAPALEQKNERIAEDQGGSNKETVSAKNKKAHKAYEGVVDRYKSFYEYCGRQDPANADYDEWASNRDDGGQLAQMFIYYAINGQGDFDYYYGLKDIDGDGVDELLIGAWPDNGSTEECWIMDVYRFLGGKAIPLIEQVDGFGGWGQASYEGFQVQGEGQAYELCKDGLIKFSCSQDAMNTTIFLQLDNGEATIVDAAMNADEPVDRQNGAYLVRSITNGSEPVEETVEGHDNARALQERFEEKHPVAPLEEPGTDGDFWNVLVKAASDKNKPGDEDTIKDEASFIANAKRELNVPDDADITYEIGDEPDYWEGTSTWVWCVLFYRNGQLIAGADCGSTGLLCRSIMKYNGK